MPPVEVPPVQQNQLTQAELAQVAAMAEVEGMLAGVGRKILLGGLAIGTLWGVAEYMNWTDQTWLDDIVFKAESPNFDNATATPVYISPEDDWMDRLGKWWDVAAINFMSDKTPILPSFDGTFDDALADKLIADGVVSDSLELTGLSTAVATVTNTLYELQLKGTNEALTQINAAKAQGAALTDEQVRAELAQFEYLPEGFAEALDSAKSVEDLQKAFDMIDNPTVLYQFYHDIPILAEQGMFSDQSLNNIAAIMTSDGVPDMLGLSRSGALESVIHIDRDIEGEVMARFGFNDMQRFDSFLNFLGQEVLDTQNANIIGIAPKILISELLKVNNSDEAYDIISAILNNVKSTADLQVFRAFQTELATIPEFKPIIDALAVINPPSPAAPATESPTPGQ